jgi:hypothetical protein
MFLLCKGNNDFFLNCANLSSSTTEMVAQGSAFTFHFDYFTSYPTGYQLVHEKRNTKFNFEIISSKKKT